MSDDKDEITLLGLKFVVNPYVPDNCIICSEKVYNILKEYKNNDSSTSILPIRGDK